MALFSVYARRFSSNFVMIRYDMIPFLIICMYPSCLHVKDRLSGANGIGASEPPPRPVHPSPNATIGHYLSKIAKFCEVWKKSKSKKYVNTSSGWYHISFWRTGSGSTNDTTTNETMSCQSYNRIIDIRWTTSAELRSSRGGFGKQYPVPGIYATVKI